MLPGMGGGADNAMMLEMQLRMARRAEKAQAEASGGSATRSDALKAQQRQPRRVILAYLGQG